MVKHYTHEVIKTNLDGTIDILEPCENKREATNAKHYWDKIYTTAEIREVKNV